MVYDLPKYTSTGKFDSFERFMSGTYIFPKQLNVGPSPVYGEGLQKDVYVHRNSVFEVGRSNTGEDFTLSQIQTLPGISDTEGSEGVVSRPIFRE
jgi:hypothetical protein